MVGSMTKPGANTIDTFGPVNSYLELYIFNLYYTHTRRHTHADTHTKDPDMIYWSFYDLRNM